ncbi:hemolysin family protein [Ichthyobacterium seriolicida]|uniref:Hemolysin n=1 Tax=Ichthyobacterium seriolicida TaxID=242600 RepID=A0A1J1ECX2_9FLAO|nr:hemolysin family protein [Ichthyobacterium seriolicida]BAV95360.1 hemolysin [Ichthyobacterium seriolicida]
MTDSIIIFVSILCSAFFSGMEIAFVASSRMRMKIDSTKGNRISSMLATISKNPNKFIVTTLIGNNISVVVYGICMGSLISKNIFPGIDPENVPWWILLIQTVLSTSIILVTAEFLPKVVFMLYPNKLLNFFTIPSYLFYQILSITKITDFVILCSNTFLKVFFKINPNKNNDVLKMEDLGEYVSQEIETVSNKRDLSVGEILKKALKFSDIKIRSSMVSRIEIVALSIDTPIEKLKEKFIKTGFSRIPIYRGDIDNIIGYVHSFEMFKQPEHIKDVILPISIIPESLLVKELLNMLIESKRNIAMVVDEYGATSGLITMENIVEELFGEIEDEHDKNLLVEVKKNDSEFIFSAKLGVSYVNKKYQLNLPESEEYSTLGGLIVFYTKDIPKKDHKITIEDDFSFLITKVSDTRIEQLELKIL